MNFNVVKMRIINFQSYNEVVLIIT